MAPQDLTTALHYQEIVDKYDVLLLDCDGVVWEGDHVLDGIHTTLQHFRKLGKRIFFVTNNATKSRAENKKKFDKMGIECHVVRSFGMRRWARSWADSAGGQDEIFSSAYATAAYLKTILNFPADKKVYVIGEKGVEDELDSVGIRYCGGTVSWVSEHEGGKVLSRCYGVQAPEDNVFIDLMDFSSVVADPEVGAVLCGLDMHFNYKKIAKAFRYLRENEGCLFIATNLDSTFPTHGSVYPGASSSPRSLFQTCTDPSGLQAVELLLRR